MATNKPTPPVVAPPKKPPVVEPACVNCVFWNNRELGDNPLVGNCRRFPHTEPVRMFHTNWCGEWKLKS